MDKSLFKRAVEDTPEATPGYMFRDIANWTFVDQNTQAKLVAALFDKLTPKTSVHVLAKVLRIIKIVCETGHSDFQKEMQRRSDQIKDYAAFRGVPHPQFGDRLNEKVRIAAKEAIDAAFTARKDNKIQVEAGHGSGEPAAKSSSYVSAATGAVSGVLGAVGFSSFTTGHQISASQAADARMAAMPTTNKWAEHMARAGAGEPSAPRQLVTNVVDKAKLGFGLFGNEQIKSNEERYWSGQADVGEFKAVDIAFVGGSRGPFGPNATPSASAATNASSSAAGATNWKFADEAEAGLPPIEHHATLTRFLTPYQREVERIAAMKHAPQRVDITQFLAAVKEIHESGDSSGASSYEDLAQTLDEGIAQKHPWQARLNVMTLIEALVRAELSPEIGAYFNENPEDVQRNVHVVQSSLKEKSQKVLRLLGIPERSSAAATAAPTASSASAAPQAGADLTFEGMTTSSRRARRGVGAVAGSEEPAATAPTVGFASSQHQQPPAVTKSPSPPSVSAADPLDVLMGAPPRQSAVAAAAADPTKLRKRAQINADDFLSNSAPTASSSAPAAAASAGWGSADANAGWGSSAGTGASSGGWGGDAASSGGWGASSGGGGGGWGETPSAAPAPAPAAAPAPAPVAAVAAKSKAAMDFDELFSSAPVDAPQQQPQTFAPIAAPSPAGPTAAQQAADQQMAMVVQMQQQVQGMLAQINMNDPSALPQMQMLMQQQQQLMTMMQQAQAAQTAANAQAAQQQQQQQSGGGVVSPSDSLSFSGPLQPHGQFNAPPLVKDHTKEKAFADVQNEMVKMLMTQK